MSEKKRPIKMGILGGMGPLATDFFFDRIVRHTEAACDQEHIDLCILNRASMPDRSAAIASGERREIVARLVEDCKKMEALGVEYIAVPCNTSHCFFEEVQAQIRATLIHMVRETVREAERSCPGLSRLGILATDGTLAADVYGKECRLCGIEPVYPSDAMQKEVMHLIYEEVKRGMPGDPDRFDRITGELWDAGCERIVLGCTELSYFSQNRDLPDTILDAMDVLVRRFIELAGRTYRE